MDPLCIHCKDGDGEIIDREVKDAGGLLVTFACAACGGTWEVTV